MDVCKAVLTVYFEAPFWAAVYEREHGGKSEACKITFGAEPKDYEVLAYLLQNYRSLQFSPPVACGGLREKSGNPKRIQREINGQMQDRGIGTKAQRALQLQREQCKAERKTRTREMRETEQQRRFELRTQKRKEKHRGH